MDLKNPKDYLGCENARNKRYAGLFVFLVQSAFGTDHDVLIGHHVTFEKHGDLATENEIPSADTLLFDHDIMRAVFGDNEYLRIIARLAMVPAMQREDLLLEIIEEHHAHLKARLVA